MITLRHYYYQQFDADYHRDVPAEGYGGWQTGQITIAPEHTAVVVMHATDCGSYEQYPGVWHCCDEVPRTYKVCREIFPGLLAAVRAAGMPLFHVVVHAAYYQQYPGFQRAKRLTGPSPASPQIEPDPAHAAIKRFQQEHVFPGVHNLQDCNESAPHLDFAPQARPVADEGIAEDSAQLFALCREAGVNHLIYAGFNIDRCLLMSPGGMIDMARHGLICSTFRQAVTAVENKETARQELCKEIGLWRVSLNFGCVFDVDDFVAHLTQ